MCANVFSPNLSNRVIQRLACLALGCAVLSGCGTTRPRVDLPELSTWESRQSVLGHVTDWEFRGRIAVKAGDEGFNGKFSWMQDEERFDATVSGPLGIGTVKIAGDEQTIVLTDKDGVETLLVDPEIELYQRYGWED